MKFPKLSCAAACLLLGTSGLTYGADDDGFKLFSGSPILYLQIRPRYEYADVDVEGGADAAKAFTTRTLIGGKFGGVFGLNGLSANIEANNVSHFGLVDKYVPEQAGYNIIADPTQTRITQANLVYALGGTTLIAGRRLHTFDNQRFIGHVGWRQMPQTYDMLAVANNSFKPLSLTAAYVTRVKRIFDGAKSTLDTNSVLVHGAYTFAPELKLTGYGYMLSSIHDTFGVRATGKIGLTGGSGSISYEAEYATQDKATLKEESMGDIQPDVEADYYKLGATLNYSGLILGAHYELLGQKDGSEGTGFNTPLATLHAMNGWADKFLGTPVDGLVDTGITVGYKNKAFGRVVVFYRTFESDNGGDDYGDELDVVFAHKFAKNLNLIVKAAFYKEGDDFGKDTTKYWAMLDYKFNF